MHVEVAGAHREFGKKTRVVHSAMKATLFSLHECSNRLVPCDTVEKPATTNQLVLALETACEKFVFLC